MEETNQDHRGYSTSAESHHREEDLKDHVKKAWEEVKIDLTGDDDDDEVMPDDDDVTMKSPEQETQPEEGDDDQASKKGDINDEKRDFREQDEVDKFLNQEGKPTDVNDDEEIAVDEINIEEYEAGEARHAVIEYPKWMQRIEFGSKVLPIEPCTIGDAQPEFIKILLLQIGLHIVRIYRLFQRNFCGDIETAWKHFQQNQKFRMDLDSRTPYLGEDENGELIEPTAQQMKELYKEIGRPNQRTTSEKRDSSMHTMGQWYSKDFSYIPLNVATRMMTCKTYSLMRRWRSCRNVIPQWMR